MWRPARIILSPAAVLLKGTNRRKLAGQVKRTLTVTATDEACRPKNESKRYPYSCRSATMGSTRVARLAGM